MILPDFFIAGAQKSGTTSLAKWLDTHPNLSCSSPKEPRFFSSSKVRQKHLDYSAFFEIEPHDCKIQYFEASTSIMNDDVAALEIKKRYADNPPKFIFIIKDPVKRAISAYYHMVKHFSEKRPIYDVFKDLPVNNSNLFDHEATKAKESIKNDLIDVRQYKDKYDNYIWPYLYVYNSMYSRHIKKFQELFGVENVLILTLENFKSSPSEQFHKITSFLGIAPYENFPDTNKKSNPTQIPCYSLMRLAIEYPIFLKFCIFTDKFLQRIFKKSLFMISIPSVPDETLDLLNEILQKDIKFWKACD